MRILALKGMDETGKSATLRRLIRKMIDSGYASFICANDKRRFEEAEKRQGDVSLPLWGRDGLIAVSTYGDTRDLLETFFKNYEDYVSCIICATHPEGTAIYTYLNKKASEKNITLELVIKQVSKDPEEAISFNQQDTEKIFDLLKSGSKNETRLWT